MNAKMTSLFAGIALLAGVGVANAEERLTAAAMDGVTAAGGSVYFSKYINTNVNAYLHVYKNVYSDVDVYGNLSHAKADASCSGFSCVTQTSTFTYSGYLRGIAL